MKRTLVPKAQGGPNEAAEAGRDRDPLVLSNLPDDGEFPSGQPRCDDPTAHAVRQALAPPPAFWVTVLGLR